MFMLFIGLGSVASSYFFWSMSFLFDVLLLTMKGLFEMSFSLFFDWVSMFFFGILMIMVFSVKSFAEFYMQHDPFFNRFHWVLMTFVASMCLLIFIPKFFLVLIGWDGLGVTSFFLIVYYQAFSSWTSGLKTFLVNRLGDGFLILGLIMLFNNGHWNFLKENKELSMVLSVLLILGFFTKSAQFPFSSWLPAAMAAPTPVSALVHSSTLVTAGVYLLIRFSHLFPSQMLGFIGVIGLMTLFLASFAACFEWDLKKIIAFSTLSQLGLMVYTMGCGLSTLGFFHLVTHAVFKALLFISAGLILGKFFHFQDIRMLGKFKNSKALVDFSLVVSILALSGFPFLAGFFSKDLMLEKTSYTSKIVFKGFFWFSLIFTWIYSLRLIYFLYKNNFPSNSLAVSLENTSLESVVLLLFCACFLGWCQGSFFCKNFFVSISLKMVLILKAILGGLVVSSMTHILGSCWFEWYSSKMGFLEFLKSFWVSKNSYKFGSVFFLFDQSMSESFNSSLKKNFMRVKGLVGLVINMFSVLNLKLMILGFFLVGLLM